MTLQNIITKIIDLKNIKGNNEQLISLLNLTISAAVGKNPLIRRLNNIKENEARSLFENKKPSKDQELFHELRVNIIMELRPYLPTT